MKLFFRNKYPEVCVYLYVFACVRAHVRVYIRMCWLLKFKRLYLENEEIKDGYVSLLSLINLSTI